MSKICCFSSSRHSSVLHRYNSSNPLRLPQNHHVEDEVINSSTVLSTSRHTSDCWYFVHLKPLSFSLFTLLPCLRTRAQKENRKEKHWMSHFDPVFALRQLAVMSADEREPLNWGQTSETTLFPLLSCSFTPLWTSSLPVAHSLPRFQMVASYSSICCKHEQGLFREQKLSSLTWIQYFYDALIQ